MIERFCIPGSGRLGTLRRDAQGRLLELSCEGRVHLHERDGERVLGDGLLVTRELRVDGTLLRHARAPRTGIAGWIESYRWDGERRLVRIDDVEVRRDDRGRIVACGEWRYRYAGDALCAIEGPRGLRRIERDGDNRPVLVREGATACTLGYDRDGRRRDAAPLPARFHRDAWGRLWSVCSDDGAVIATFLWDGWRCLGRIDGEPDQPLAAAFCLDPTGTPVRIVGAREVLRVPRDAFGEALLEIEGAVGLFGGALHGGLVHLRARPLDPRTGSFTAPDPWDGGAGDPRRKTGYTGVLTVEHARAGRYAACQNDPVARVDPTGEISFPWWVLLSDLTWSYGHLIASIFGLDLTVNFPASLIYGIGQAIFGSSTPNVLVDYLGSLFDGVSATRGQGFGLRRGGALAPSGFAFTYHHIMFSRKVDEQTYTKVNVFDPKGAFALTHYGTVLRLDPSDGGSFVLRGTANPGLQSKVGLPLGWVRGGGAATPVFPGSLVPWFPSGGLHINYGTSAAHDGPQDCTATELWPTGRFGVVVDQTTQLTVALAGSPAVASLVFVIDAAGNDFIADVIATSPSDGKNQVTLDLAGGQPGPLRVRALQPAPNKEQATGLAAPAGYLGTAGTTFNYLKDDPVRITQGGSVLAATILRLESQIAVDGPLPAGLVNFVLTLASPTGTPVSGTATAANLFTVDPGLAVPVSPSTIVLRFGATIIPCAVTNVTGQAVTVDRTLTAGTAGTWQALSSGGALFGNAAGADAGATITYTPQVLRNVPTAGFVVASAASGATARSILAPNYDALVLTSGAALPGTPANPYQVERFSFGALDETVTGSDLGTVQYFGFAPARNTALGSPPQLTGKALRLIELSGSTVGPGGFTPFPNPAPPALPVVTVASTTTLSIGPLTSPLAIGDPAPGEVMTLTVGPITELQVVTSLTMQVTLDRTITVSSAGADAVPLSLGSQAYDATLQTAAPSPIVTVLSTVTQPAPVGKVTVETPRFNPGEIVLLGWAGSNDLFSVALVETTATGGLVDMDSSTLTLTGGTLAAGAAAPFTVTRLVPIDPGTGGTRDGIAPVTVAPPANPTNSNTNTLTFSVWTPGALLTSAPGVSTTIAGNSPVGFLSAPLLPVLGYAIVSGGQAAPVRFQPVRTLTVVLGQPTQFAVGTPVQLSTAPVFVPPPPPPGTPATVVVGDSARFSLTSDGRLAVTYDADNGTPSFASGQLVVAVEYDVPAIAPTVTAKGSLSPSTVLITNDTSYELDRRDAVREHEMRHMFQSSLWGPWLFGFAPWSWLPDWVQDDPNLPKWSDNFAGSIVSFEGNKATITFGGVPGGVSLAKSDMVDCGGYRFKLGDTITSTSGQAFYITADDYMHLTALANNGIVQARKIVEQGFWKSLGPSLGSNLANFTLGSVLQWLVASTTGSAALFIGHCFYALGRLIFGSGKSYPGTVDADGMGITLSNADAKDALKDASQIQVQQDKALVVRELDGSAAVPNLKIKQKLDLTGEVQVAPFTTHTPGSAWDWNDYYPASVPDANKSSTVKIEKVGSSGLTLSAGDTVSLKSDTTTVQTLVMNVNGDGTVELRDAPLFTDKEFRISQVSAQDPVGSSWGGAIARWQGSSAMTTVIDPWIKIIPKEGSSTFLTVLYRVLRWLLSTHGWSPVFPGWYLLDNLPAQLRKDPRGNRAGFRSQMEQDASEESGDVYSPLGRLEKNQWGVVGDIARYWYTIQGRFSSEYGWQNTGAALDAPGVWIAPNDRVIPLVTAETITYASSSYPAAAASPNLGAAAPAPASAPAPSTCVPDALFAKPVRIDPRDTVFGRAAAADPDDPNNVGGPRSYAANHRGHVQLSPRVVRSNGIYVSFTQPGKHRITVADGISGGDDSRWVQDNKAGAFDSKSVTLLFDETVADVTVAVGGVPVVEGSTLSLVLTQIAPVAVVPNGARNYALTLQRPALGTSLRGGQGPLTLVAQATVSAAPEPVEVCRVYRWNATAQKFDDSILNDFGFHLPADLRIPVRRFTVQVVSSLTVRKLPSLNSTDDINTIAPGQTAWVLVPANASAPLALAFSYTPAAPADTTNPSPTVQVAARTDPAVPAAVWTWLGPSGSVTKIGFAATDPPEEVATVGLSINVGAGGRAGTLTGQLTYNPVFRLDKQAAAASYQVQRGTTFRLVGTNPSGGAANVSSATATPNEGITITTNNDPNVDVKVDPTAPLGTVRIVAQDTSTPPNTAVRTLRIIA
jgi:hypothetical protein